LIRLRFAVRAENTVHSFNRVLPYRQINCLEQYSVAMTKISNWSRTGIISEEEWRISAMMMDALIAHVNKPNRLLDGLAERTRNQHAPIENLLRAVIRLERRSGFADPLGNVLFWAGCAATVTILRVAVVALALAWTAPALAFDNTRPAEWCGWYMRQQVPRDPGPDFNLAANWAHYGRAAASAGVGVIVVWSHHVGKIVGRSGRDWIILSGNVNGTVQAQPFSLSGVIALRSP
jgi:hypothetical protein